MDKIAGQVQEITSDDQFNDFQKNNVDMAIVLFYAEFHEACRSGGQLDVIFSQLAMIHPRLRFAKVSAEDFPDISEKYDINVVPTFILLKGSKVSEKLEDSTISDLAKKIDVYNKNIESNKNFKNPHSKALSDTMTAEDKVLEIRLQKLINASPIMVFMKGSPSSPRCGFSKQLIEIMNLNKISYGSFDILSDNVVRESLKKYSNWPTYPQIYSNGSLIGGLDIVKEMIEEDVESFRKNLGCDFTGTLKDRESYPVNEKQMSKAELDINLKELIISDDVMVFIKGTPSEPKCGFSRKMIQILRENGVCFSSFDILENAEVRQGLKAFSNWPTYPQLYVNGTLVGGLDILTEIMEKVDLKSNGEVKSLLEKLGVKDSVTSLERKLKSLISAAPVVVFMKGSKNEPQCGFSRVLVDILQAESIRFFTFDILGDNAVRQGLKKYSNWPTYPQLYVNGQLVGGLDIVKEMQESSLVDQLCEDYGVARSDICFHS